MGESNSVETPRWPFLENCNSLGDSGVFPTQFFSSRLSMHRLTKTDPTALPLKSLLLKCPVSSIDGAFQHFKNTVVGLASHPIVLSHTPKSRPLQGAKKEHTQYGGAENLFLERAFAPVQLTNGKPSFLLHPNDGIQSVETELRLGLSCRPIRHEAKLVGHKRVASNDASGR